MPTERDKIHLDGTDYYVPSGYIRYDDLTYNPETHKYETSGTSDELPEDSYAQTTWEDGAHFFRFTPDVPIRSQYFQGKNVESAFGNGFWPAPEFLEAKTVVPGSMAGITKFVNFNGVLIALGGTKAYYLSTTLPNGFTDSGTTFPANVTDAIVYNGYLVIALGESNKYYYTTNTNLSGLTQSTLSGDGAYPKFFTVLNGTLYGAGSKTGSRTTTSIYASTDVSNGTGSWVASANVGETMADITGFVEYLDSLLVFKEDGIYQFDSVRGEAFQVAPEMKNFQTTGNGSVFAQLGSTIYFKYRESVAAWAGSAGLNLNVAMGLNIVGPDAELNSIADSQGSPVAMFAMHPFIYVAVKNVSGKYYVRKSKAGNAGWHDWLYWQDYSANNAITGMYIWTLSTALSNGNPVFLIADAAKLWYAVYPRYVDHPLMDSNCTFTTNSMVLDTPRLNLNSYAFQEGGVAIEVYAENLSASKTITVTYGVDGATPSTDPTGTGGNVLNSSGLSTIEFPVESSTIVGRDFQIRLTCTSNSNTSPIIVRMIRFRGHTYYPHIKQWLINVPATDQSNEAYSPYDIETRLKASRVKKQALKFIDRFNDTYHVKFKRLAKQGSQALAGMEPQAVFEVQLVQWPRTGDAS